MKQAHKVFLAIFLFFSVSATASAVTLRAAYDSDPISLDPYQQLSGGMLQYSHMVFTPMLSWTNDNQGFKKGLATKWQSIDANTTRFYLRKGVKFHSGNSFSAKDVLWTFNRVKQSEEFKAIFDPIKQAKVIDPYTIDFITDKPYPLMLNVMTYLFPMDSHFYSGIDAKGNDKAQISKVGESFASTNESGTGPFQVKNRQQGVKTVYSRFEDYWDKQSSGNVDTIILTPIKEASTRTAALLAGDLDFIFPVSPRDEKRIKSDPKHKLITMSGERIITLQVNQKRVPAFANKKIRQAMVYAINNQAIAKKIMRGFATPAGQLSPKGYVGHNPELVPRYDLAKAKKLMQEAGYANGFTVSMLAPNNRYVNDEKIAQAVAAMLAKIKIKVNLKTLPKAQYWTEYDNRSADILMIGWSSDTEDSANLVEFLLMCPDKKTGFGQYNSGNYCNKQVDDLIKKSASTVVDLQARASMLQHVEKIIYDDAAFIPLHWQNLAWATSNNVQLESIVNIRNFLNFGDLVIKSNN